jgi:hypothetical protein
VSTSPTAPSQYGLVKPPAVQAALTLLPLEARVPIEDALAALSVDPRPAASQPSDAARRGENVLEQTVDAAGERWLVVYAVDDTAKRVTVVAVERVFV